MLDFVALLLRCMSQVRAMYELMKANGREIVIGGTSIITAKDYIAEIEGLSR
jgi:hypothetical protein